MSPQRLLLSAVRSLTVDSHCSTPMSPRNDSSKHWLNWFDFDQILIEKRHALSLTISIISRLTEPTVYARRNVATSLVHPAADSNSDTEPMP